MSLSLKREVVAKVAAEAHRTGKSMSRIAEEMLASAEPHVMVEEVRCGCGAVVGKKKIAIAQVDHLRLMHAKDRVMIDEALKVDFRCGDCGATVRQ